MDAPLAPWGLRDSLSRHPLGCCAVRGRPPRIRPGLDRSLPLRCRAPVPLPGRAALRHLGRATTSGPGAGRLAGAGFVRGPSRVPLGLGIIGSRVAGGRRRIRGGSSCAVPRSGRFARGLGAVRSSDDGHHLVPGPGGFGAAVDGF
jgi:hypothetical protein